MLSTYPQNGRNEEKCENHKNTKNLKKFTLKLEKLPMLDLTISSGIIKI